MMFSGIAVAQQNQPAPTAEERARTGMTSDRKDAAGVDNPMDESNRRTQVTDPAIRTATPDQFLDQLRTIAADPTTAGDKFFVLCASKENACEIDTARRALTKTQNPEVKRIAQSIIDDHQKAQNDLRAAAQALNIQMITTAPPLAKQVSEVFFALPEEEFNKAYLSHLKAAHAAAISKYSDQARLARNEAVKEYASKTLPILRQHNQMVLAAAQGVGLPGLAESDTGVIGERR